MAYFRISDFADSGLAAQGHLEKDWPKDQLRWHLTQRHPNLPDPPTLQELPTGLTALVEFHRWAHGGKGH